MQDSEGYMWFATENGISRFDSQTFQNYFKKDGLNSNFILNMVEKENRIYIGTRTDGVNVFNNNKISNLNFNDNHRFWLSKIVLHNNNLYKFYSTDISMIEEDSLILIYSNALYPVPKIRSFSINWLYSFNNSRLLVASGNGLFEIKGTQIEKPYVESLGNSELYCITSDVNNNIYASGDNVIYKISENKVIETYNFNFTGEKKIYRLLVDQNSNIWFSVLGEGLFLYNPRSNHLTDLSKKLDADKLHINSLYLDRNNNVWVCTYGKGVYCFYNTFIENYDTKDGLNNQKINSISGDKEGRIYCGTYNGLSILEKNSFTNISTFGSPTFTDYIRTIKKENDSLFIICYSGGSLDFLSKKYKNVELLYTIQRCPVFISDDTLLGGGWGNNLTICAPYSSMNKNYMESIIYTIGDIIEKIKTNDLSTGSDKKIWIASDRGISILKDKEIMYIKENLLNGVFYYIKEDKSGFTWACGEKGLFILKDTNVVYEFSKDDQGKVSCFDLDNEGHAWISTMKGLYGMSVHYENGTIDLKKEYLLNENAGLISNDISSMYYDRTSNRLWAGTSNGLISVDLEDLNKYLGESLPLKILDISTPDSVYNLNEKIIFPDNIKNIRFSVSSFDLNSTGNLQYIYKLTKEDTVWSSASEDIINFPSLSYGDYDFQIYAKNNFGKISDTSVINFTVDTPFTRSYFFYGLIALSTMSLTGFAVSRSLKKKYFIEKERNTFKNQISDLKQRSLVSMMNPHFVFNSLNSIQSFYNYKENESANEYLAKFSRLIRMNLDFADKTFIKLSDELERLESYLMLEKMRFDDDLQYEIWVSDDIDPEKTDIPNMIIQPFVENAIWHGILKSHNEGKVTVNIFHSELPEDIRKNYHIQIHSSLTGKTAPDPNPIHCIKIEIIDNGIGINNCQKNKSSDHISRGISVIKERLSILHHYAGETELVKITDRSELPVPQSGTIVEIYLTPNICKVNDSE